MNSLQIVLHRFIRSMRDTFESAQSSAVEFGESNSIGKPTLVSSKLICIPQDFAGLYSQDMSDVMTTDFDNKPCFAVSEYVFSFNEAISTEKLVVPENSGLVRIIESKTIDIEGEPT